MYYALLLGRVIHVLSGVMWVGTVVFLARFLLPAMSDTGPDSSKVMEALGRRRFLQFVPILALLTILSGIWLFWHDSSASGGEFMGSRMGITLSIGALLAIVSAIIGGAVIGPSMKKAIELTSSAATADASQREALLSEAMSRRNRGAGAIRLVMWLLVLAAIAMAVARYV